MAALQPLDRAVDGPDPASTGASGAASDPGETTASPGSRPAGRRRRKQGIAFWLAVGWLVLVFGSALFAEWLPLADPLRPDVSSKLDGPSLAHPLGADGLGRDQLSRVVHAA